MTRNRVVVPAVLGLAALCLATSCKPPGDVSQSASGSSNRTPQVYVVNYPLRYFAERIGGEAVEVHFPVPGNVDPAFWNPDAEAVARFQADFLCRE